MTMKILADLHHADLYFSLKLLFEDRLGWELYRPIGLDWFHEGFWKIAEPYGNALDTVNQYLNISNTGWDQYKNLNGQHYIEDGVYYSFDPGHDYYHRAITLEKFKEMKFDVVMSTIPAHDNSFKSLVEKYQPHAKHISQMGNVNQTTGMKNVLYTVPFTPASWQNACFYHQELDLKLYTHQPIDHSTKNIYSMVNCLPYSDIYNKYKNALPGISFKAFGGSCPDGALSGAKGVSEKMREANIGWHLKPLDGFGHTAMGWFASGRPIITKMSDVVRYGPDGFKLFEPGVTCIDIEAGTFEQNIAKINELLQPEASEKMGAATRKRFFDIINYDKEEQDIRKFIERLI